MRTSPSSGRFPMTVFHWFQYGARKQCATPWGQPWVRGASSSTWEKQDLERVCCCPPHPPPPLPSSGALFGVRAAGNLNRVERVGTGRDRVSVSLNALCVSVIRNLMALSEIPKLYLAGRGSHHSAPHNLLINSKRKKKKEEGAWTMTLQHSSLATEGR